jgi:DNA-binding NtrC family response regulator
MGIKSQSIVAVDDDERTLNRIRIILDPTHVVLATAVPKQALSWLENDATSAVVIAQNLRGCRALELLEAAQKLRPNARRILIAVYSDLALFVNSFHSGAIQRTISTPIDANELLGLVRVRAIKGNPFGGAPIAA